MSFTAVNINVGGTSAEWRSYTIELKTSSPNFAASTASATSTATGSLTTAIQMRGAAMSVGLQTASIGTFPVVVDRAFAASDGTNVVVVSGAGGSNVVRSTDSGANWTDISTAAGSATSYDICYGNGKFVRVRGFGTTLDYSTDGGATWNTTTIPVAAISVAYGAGVFVILPSASSSSAYSSTDLVTWTPRTLPSTITWTRVRWAGDRFIAACNSTRVAYSTDGITWTNATIAGGRVYNRVAYANGISVVSQAVGSAVGHVRSTDGTTWSDVTTGGAQSGVVAAGGIFMVQNWQTSQIQISTDALVWTNLSGLVIGLSDLTLLPDGSLLLLYYSNTAFADKYTITGGVRASATGMISAPAQFVASVSATSTVTGDLTTGIPLAASVTAVATPTAGLTTQIKLRGLGAPEIFTGVSQAANTNFNGGYLVDNGAGVQVVFSAAYTFSSTNNFASQTTTTQTYGSPTSCVAVGGTFYLVDGSATVYTSTNGISWTATYTAPGNVKYIAHNGTTWILSVNGFSQNYYYGTSLSSLSTGTTLQTFTQHNISWVNGLWISSLASNSALNVSSDGLTWTNVSLGTSIVPMGQVVYFNGKYFVALTDNTVKSSTNGTAWSDIAVSPVKPTSGIYKLSVANKLLFLCGGGADNTTLRYSPDGASFLGVTPTYLPSSVAGVYPVTATRFMATYNATGFGSPYSLFDVGYPSAAAALTTGAGAAALASSVSAVSTTTADLTTQIKLAASVAGVSATTGALTTQIRLAANATDTSNVVLASLTTGIPLGSAAAVVSSVTSASLTTQIRLATSALGVAASTGAITTSIQLAASVQGIAAASAGLLVPKPLAASVAAVSAASANLSIPKALVSAVTNVASTTGALTTQIRLAANAADTSNVVLASLTTGIPLGSALAVVSTVTSAALTTQTRFATNATAVAATTGALTTQIRLNSAVSAISTATADLTVGWNAAAAIQSVASVSGDLTTAIQLGGVLRSGLRQNLVANSTMQGAALGIIGSGGAVPTGWSIGSTTGVTREVVGLGKLADGNPYIDIRWYGTNTSGVTSYPDLYPLTPGANNAASAGMTVSAGLWMQMTAGSRANFASGLNRISVGGWTSANAWVESAASTVPDGTYATITKVLVGATVAKVASYVDMSLVNGATVDITLRVAMPQVEYGTPTGYTPTYGTAINQGRLVAPLTTAIRLAANAQDTSNVVLASLTTGIPLGAAAAVVSSVASAQLTVGVKFTASATATSTAAGALTTGIQLGAAVASVSNTVTATLTGAAAALAGSASNEAYASAAVTTSILLASVAASSATAVAERMVSGAIALTALASSQSLVSAYLKTYSPNATYNVSQARADLLYQIALLHGLVIGSPLRASATSRTAGEVDQTVTNGPVVTIHTNSGAQHDGDLNQWIDALAALHGLTTDLTVTAGTRNAGSIMQTLSSDGTTTTVTRL